jgi:hypothetical protein
VTSRGWQRWPRSGWPVSVSGVAIWPLRILVAPEPFPAGTCPASQRVWGGRRCSSRALHRLRSPHLAACGWVRCPMDPRARRFGTIRAKTARELGIPGVRVQRGPSSRLNGANTFSGTQLKKKKKKQGAGQGWFMPVIRAPWKAEVGGSRLEANLGK